MRIRSTPSTSIGGLPMVYSAKVQPPTGGVGYRTFAQYEYTLQEKGLRRVSLTLTAL